MKQSARRVAFAALAILWSASMALSQEGEQCGVCHPESRVSFESSIHSREEVSCSSCHRGDPSSRQVERAHGGDFRSLEDRLAIPALCAECHASLEQMRAYNLPVDQYAVYLTSQHGRAVASGDDRAAICTDCHGTHEIRSESDPGSSVNPANIATTCGHCHGNDKLMRDYGLDVDVIENYRSSVHGVALLVERNQAAPNCTSCHGVHGPTPPGVGDIDKVCGACHAQTRRAFLESPHARAMREAGLPECESCHSNHAIRRFEVASIEQACQECHAEDSDEMALGKRIHALIDSAAEEVSRAEALTAQGSEAALEIEDHLSRLEEARTYLTEASTLVHTVSQESVEEVTRRARSIGEEVQLEIYDKLDRRTAHLGLVVFWFYLAMTLAIFFGYKRRLARRSASS